ncbi:MAG: dihydrodipicolinate synthase family protein [Anaerolineales bacterium]
MMTDHPLAGVYAAAVTPLTCASTPDLEAVPVLLAFLAGRGCHGALLFGTTGEGPSFSLSERREIWQAALQIRQVHPDFHLLAGCGTPSLSESIELTRAAFDLGYDAAVVLPPYYFRSAPEDGLFDWFSTLIRQAVPSDGSLLGYHIPGMTGVGFSLELLNRLKDTFPRQFAGIKDSSHDARFAAILGETFGDDLLVFSGTDSYFSLALQNHAAGCITAPANLLSPDLRIVYDTFCQGQDTSAVQTILTARRQVLEKYLPFPPLIKALLARIHGFPRWPVRPPLIEIDEVLLRQAAAELAQAGQLT